MLLMLFVGEAKCLQEIELLNSLAPQKSQRPNTFTHGVWE